MKGRVILKLAARFLADKQHVVDVALIDIRQEFGKTNFFFFLGIVSALHHLPKQEGGNHNDRPEQYRLNR